MTNIFIGNLAPTVRECDLHDLFAEFGEIQKVQIITDHETGESRGFGFLLMNHDRDAMLAIEQLNGREWDGQVIQVKIARHNPNRAR